MPPANFENCATNVITMIVPGAEQWKIRPDDEFLAEDMQPSTTKNMGGGEGGCDMVLKDMDDDLAEEGALGRLVPQRAG